MGLYIVNTDILNIRSSPSADSDDTYVGFLRKGEKIWLEDNTVAGTIPADSTSNQWRIYGENYVLDEWVDKEGSYAAKKQEFVSNKALTYLHNDSEDEGNWNVDWGFVDLEIWKIWETYKTKGAGIKIAIIDSGLDINSGYFNKGKVTCYDMSKGGVRVTNIIDPDDYKHGTNCAGIIVANSDNWFGICPDAELIMLKVMTDDGTRRPAYILQAIDLAKTLGVHVVSISKGVKTFYEGEQIDELYEISSGTNKITIKDFHNKIVQLYKSGATLVVSAGNEYSRLTNTIPALFDECISVGAIDKEGKRGTQSTRSDFLDIVAPGEKIKVISSVSLLSGTSYSAPYVAGVIALAKAIGYDNNNIELQQTLYDTASRQQISSYSMKEYGQGIINPLKFIKQLTS